MNTMLKVTLVIALFVSTAMSGDMGNGGAPCSQNCGTGFVSGDSIKASDVILILVKEYLRIR